MSLRAAKHLTHAALLTPDELRALFASLPPHTLYNVSAVTDDLELDCEIFFDHYASYYNGASLSSGMRAYCTAALSSDGEAIERIEVPHGYIGRVQRPVVQLRPHAYSIVDGRICSMTRGGEATPFGIAFSFPQIYQTPSGEVVEVYKEQREPNALLFRALSLWIRRNTRPAPIRVGEAVKRATFRIGEAACL